MRHASRTHHGHQVVLRAVLAALAATIGAISWSTLSWANSCSGDGSAVSLDAQSALHQATFYDFATAAARSLAESDREVVRSPEHATRFLGHGKKTPKAILILHGLHESPDYMRSFAEYFYSHGYNVLSLRLPGHFEKDPQALNRVTAEQWARSVEDAYQVTRMLGDKVEVLGYSTGGLLAAHLALLNPGKVNALYLIAPALALSSKVQLTAASLGRTGLDLHDFCESADSRSPGCRLLLYSDPQLEVMLKEGIHSSPAAGGQVQRLLNQMANRHYPARHSSPKGVPKASYGPAGYQDRLRSIYARLDVPMVMVNSASDDITDPAFNSSLMKTYKGRHQEVFFPKSRGISHIMINKARDNAYKKSPNVYNPAFDEILKAIEALQKS